MDDTAAITMLVLGIIFLLLGIGMMVYSNMGGDDDIVAKSANVLYGGTNF